MSERSHVSVKVESRSDFTFNLNNLYLAFILFTWLKFTCVNVHSQKRVSGNQPLSTVSKHLLLGLPLKICRTIPCALVVQAMDFGASTSGFEARLCHLIFIYLESNAVILLKFWRAQPTLLYIGLQYFNSTRRGQRCHFLQCRVFAESSLCKQEWRNPKEGRVGCLHQNIFMRKEIDIAFTSDFCDNNWHPVSPASLYLTSPRPKLDVLKSLVSRPQVQRRLSRPSRSMHFGDVSQTNGRETPR